MGVPSPARGTLRPVHPSRRGTTGKSHRAARPVRGRAGVAPARCGRVSRARSARGGHDRVPRLPWADGALRPAAVRPRSTGSRATASGGRSTTCGSRSPTAATSGACTACPRRSSGADFAFLPRELVLTFEEIERLARVFVGLGAEKLRITGGEPLVRRDLPRLSSGWRRSGRRRASPVDLTLTTNGSALRALARRPGGGRAGSDHGEPGLAGRRDVPVDERRRLPGGQGARRDRRRAGGRPRPAQDQHGRPARPQRDERRADGPLGTERGPDPPLHRVHGRRPHERLADGRRRAGGRDPRLDRRGDAARARPAELSGRGRATATATSTGPGRSGSSRR